MSGYYVVAQDGGDDYLIVSMAEGVLAFEDKHDAEDFIDKLDEPGEFTVIPYEDSMGKLVIVQ